MQQPMYASGPQVMQPAIPQYAPPKKYTLARPDRKPLSDALDVPGFYPLEPKAGEELFLRHCIGGGYYEPMTVNVRLSLLVVSRRSGPNHPTNRMSSVR